MTEFFDKRDVDQYTDSLSRYLPGGELFQSKNIESSNLRKFLRGLATEFYRQNGYLREYLDNILPDTTVKFISEWESAVGIPDSCFPGTGSIDERRTHVLMKLMAQGTQTEQDFIDLAAMLGVDISIVPGIEEITFPLVFPVLFFSTTKEARFTMIVEFSVQEDNKFPLEFPIVFGNGLIAILECFFSKLKPANVQLIFRQV